MMGFHWHKWQEQRFDVRMPLSSTTVVGKGGFEAYTSEEHWGLLTTVYKECLRCPKTKYVRTERKWDAKPMRFAPPSAAEERRDG